MTTGEIIALVSLGIALVTVLLTGRRDTRGSAATEAQTQAKLDSIASGVDDIRIEQRAMRDRVDSISERVAKVEGSVSSAHKRIDRLDKERSDNND